MNFSPLERILFSIFKLFITHCYENRMLLDLASRKVLSCSRSSLPNLVGNHPTEANESQFSWGCKNTKLGEGGGRGECSVLLPNFSWNTGQKMKFPFLSIFSVNVTKSAGYCGFVHIYWRNPKSLMGNFIFIALKY